MTVSGMVPVQRIDGSPYMGDFNLYEIDPTDTTAIFKHDPVALAGGFVARGDGAAAICGVLVGVRYMMKSAPGGYIWRPDWDGVDPGPANGVGAGNTPIFAEVADSPDLVYSVKATGTLARADFGGLFDLTLGSGDAATGASTGYVDLDGSAGTLLRLLPATRQPVPGDDGIGVDGTRTMQAIAMLHQFAPASS